MSTLTQGEQRQKATLKLIREFRAQHGYGPSVDELAKGLGVSKTSVRKYLGKLEESGLIERSPGVQRSIVVAKRR